MLQHSLPYTKSKIIALLLLNQPTSNHNTIFRVLKYVVEDTTKLDQSSCIVTFDQPLYIKAKDIVASAPFGELSNAIVRLGGFHPMMSYLGSFGYIMNNSGLTKWWSTVYGAATVLHMLSGHAFARAIRAHLLTYSALSTIMLEKMPIDDVDYLQQLLINFAENPTPFPTIENDQVIEKGELHLSSHITLLRERGKTAQLWLIQ